MPGWVRTLWAVDSCTPVIKDLKVTETLDQVARAIRSHGEIIEASTPDGEAVEVTMIDQGT